MTRFVGADFVQHEALICHRPRWPHTAVDNWARESRAWGDRCAENELPSDPTQRRQSSTLSADRQLGANARARFEPNPLKRSVSSRHDVSPDPCRPAVVTKSTHRHSPQETGRGRSCDRARAAKSLNASTATAQTTVTEPNRSQSPLCLCKAPPNFTIPVPAPSPGMAPDYLSLWSVDWFKCNWEDRGDTPKLTKWCHAGMVSGVDEKCQFYRSAPAALI